MFARFFGRTEDLREPADALYREIVARARQPGLYRHLGVPDTLEGRLEMIMLHCLIVFRRLHREGESGQALSQQVFDVFCTDMDRSLREIGVGDLGVPKRMKVIGKSFYGRADVYGGALAARDEAELAGALQRNLFPDQEDDSTAMQPLARYAIAATDRLHDEPMSGILAGNLPMADSEPSDRVPS